jgi:hypothetical protein
VLWGTIGVVAIVSQQSNTVTIHGPNGTTTTAQCFNLDNAPSNYLLPIDAAAGACPIGTGPDQGCEIATYDTPGLGTGGCSDSEVPMTVDSSGEQVSGP